jgi:hypothetical protein
MDLSRPFREHLPGDILGSANSAFIRRLAFFADWTIRGGASLPID